MVTKIEEYRCEICGSRHKSLEEAQECESRGKPDLSEIPNGLMRGNPESDKDHYRNMTFAIAETSIFNSNPHLFIVGMWACRDTPAGDSLEDSLCSNGMLHDKTNWRNKFQHKNLTIEDLDHPTWKRMEEWLVSQGITPTCIINEEVVSVEEARKFLQGGE